MTKFYTLVVCLALCQCKPKELSVNELHAYVIDEANGLIHSTDINGTKVSVSYRPTDLCVAQEFDSGGKETLDSLRKKYSNYHYFILSLTRDNGEALNRTGDMRTYSQLVETMSFRMSDYVTLTTASRDTIPVGDFMMNRTYGLAASSDILFVFNREDIKESQWLQFNLNEFGLGVGNQQFRFANQYLEEVPRVNFSVLN